MLTYICAALAVVAIAEALVIIRVSKALHAIGRFGERLAHLASALELLTDTTEAGLGNVAVALERGAQQRATRSSRGATSRRIASASNRGGSIEDIAARESLSESEVRLHLHLAPTNTLKGAGHGALRS